MENGVDVPSLHFILYFVSFKKNCWNDNEIYHFATSVMCHTKKDLNEVHDIWHIDRNIAVAVVHTHRLYTPYICCLWISIFWLVGLQLGKHDHSGKACTRCCLKFFSHYIRNQIMQRKCVRNIIEQSVCESLYMGRLWSIIVAFHGHLHEQFGQHSKALICQCEGLETI